MSESIRVTIRCFSHVRDVLKRRDLSLDVPAGTTAGEITEKICAMAGGKLDRLSFRVAINQSFAADSDPVSDGDEVALIPPVQGG